VWNALVVQKFVTVEIGEPEMLTKLWEPSTDYVFCAMVI
jgi:hypothetical protein